MIVVEIGGSVDGIGVERCNAEPAHFEGEAFKVGAGRDEDEGLTAFGAGALPCVGEFTRREQSIARPGLNGIFAEEKREVALRVCWLPILAWPR